MEAAGIEPGRSGLVTPPQAPYGVAVTQHSNGEVLEIALDPDGVHL